MVAGKWQWISNDGGVITEERFSEVMGIDN
jgi:hypothetical protein